MDKLNYYISKWTSQTNNTDKNILSVDKNTFDKLKSIFDPLDVGGCFCTIGPDKETYHITFMTHQGVFYSYNENSLKYCIYIDKN